MRMIPRITMLQRAYAECGLVGLAPAARCYFGSMDQPLTGLLKLGGYPNWTTALYDEYAQHKFVGFSYGAIRQEDRKELIQRNPDIMIGSYVSLFHVQPWMYGAPIGSFARKWANDMTTYLLHDKWNERCALYGENWVWDFLNPEARATAIDLIAEYVHAGKTPLDWLMLDFMSVPMPDLGGVNSEVVLERFNSDEEALEFALCDYLEKLKAACPSTLLIPNGEYLLRQDFPALLADGAFVEWAFRWFFGTEYGEPPAVANALDPLWPYSLHYLTGDRYNRSLGIVMLEQREDGDPSGIATIAPQFPGCVHMRRIP